MVGFPLVANRWAAAGFGNTLCDLLTVHGRAALLPCVCSELLEP